MEQVNHPQHYGGGDNPYEAIKVIEAWGLGFCLGNTVKYISRAGKKQSDKTVQDLEKAAWYLKRYVVNGVIDVVEIADEMNPLTVAREWGLNSRLGGVIVCIAQAVTRPDISFLSTALEKLELEIEILKGATHVTG